MLPTSRLIRSLDAKASRPSKAPAPQAGGTAEGSSRPKAVSGIKPKEEKLAGYFLARASMHRKIEDKYIVRPDGTVKERPVVRNLRAAHASVQEVNELLPLGRSNVIPDIEKAKDQHIFLRKKATNELVDSLQEYQERTGGLVTGIEFSGTIAAAAQHAKTGSCGCFSTNITALHGAKLGAMQDTRAVVAYTEHTSIDHAWSEMMPKGTHPDRTPIFHGKDIIMDGWCKEKVAIHREDSHFARLDNEGKADHLIHEDILDHVIGPVAWKTVEKYKAQIDNNPVFQEVFDDTLNRLVDSNPELSKESLWNDTSVFHTDFREQAGKALHRNAGQSSPIPDADPVSVQAKHASLAEIRAVGVARSLGSNVRGAIADAPGIIASAKDMFPNPESKKRKRDEAESSR
ncbi:MAG TPA: hypothetical protein VK465_09565 [Fibrobacteria bacterium]|nr:hypothetical protein [Fibrobacteria bacterium]